VSCAGPAAEVDVLSSRDHNTNDVDPSCADDSWKVAPIQHPACATAASAGFSGSGPAGSVRLDMACSRWSIPTAGSATRTRACHKALTESPARRTTARGNVNCYRPSSTCVPRACAAERDPGREQQRPPGASLPGTMRRSELRHPRRRQTGELPSLGVGRVDLDWRCGAGTRLIQIGDSVITSRLRPPCATTPSTPAEQWRRRNRVDATLRLELQPTGCGNGIVTAGEESTTES